VLALAALTAEIGVAAVYGIAERGGDGAAYITQVVAQHGRIEGVQRKRHLGEGEEAFAVSDDNAEFDLGDTRIAIAICAEAGIDRPFAHARAVGARLVCFAAAPGLYERRTTEPEWRAGWDWWLGCGLADAQRHAREQGLWIAIATQAGSTVDEDFPGLAALVDPCGEVVAQLPDWHPGTLVVDVPG
jgi:predicted amidohydrolase